MELHAQVAFETHFGKGCSQVALQFAGVNVQAGVKVEAAFAQVYTQQQLQQDVLPLDRSTDVWQSTSVVTWLLMNLIQTLWQLCSACISACTCHRQQHQYEKFQAGVQFIASLILTANMLETLEHAVPLPLHTRRQTSSVHL